MPRPELPPDPSFRGVLVARPDAPVRARAPFELFVTYLLPPSSASGRAENRVEITTPEGVRWLQPGFPPLEDESWFADLPPPATPEEDATVVCPGSLTWELVLDEGVHSIVVVMGAFRSTPLVIEVPSGEPGP